jgi:hypothetical protein
MIEEIWSTIDEFPQYSISNYGNVRNDLTGHLLAPNPNNHGHIKINLMDLRTREKYTRSVALLVATAFVVPPDRRSDCIIVLDGNLSNVTAWNLAWRPRGFAWEYTHQLKTQQPLAFQNLRVQNETYGFVYLSIIEAGKSEGVLFKDIWRSACSPPQSRPRIYPHRATYRVVERV